MVASIPAFSTCHFHVVPRAPGVPADKKTGSVVLYRRIKPVCAWGQLVDSFNVLFKWHFLRRACCRYMSTYRVMQLNLDNSSSAIKTVHWQLRTLQRSWRLMCILDVSWNCFWLQACNQCKLFEWFLIVACCVISIYVYLQYSLW